MIPSLTIDFNVVEARDKMVEVRYNSGKSFVLIHLSRQIELDEPQEVMTTSQRSSEKIRP
jgi:hypothetical protein